MEPTNIPVHHSRFCTVILSCDLLLIRLPAKVMHRFCRIPNHLGAIQEYVQMVLLLVGLLAMFGFVFQQQEDNF